MAGAVCVFITAVPIIKLFALGKGDSGGHVLRETPRPVWTSVEVSVYSAFITAVPIIKLFAWGVCVFITAVPIIKLFAWGEDTCCERRRAEA